MNPFLGSKFLRGESNYLSAYLSFLFKNKSGYLHEALTTRQASLWTGPATHCANPGKLQAQLPRQLKEGLTALPGALRICRVDGAQGPSGEARVWGGGGLNSTHSPRCNRAMNSIKWTRGLTGPIGLHNALIPRESWIRQHLSLRPRVRPHSLNVTCVLSLLSAWPFSAIHGNWWG